MPLIKKRDTLSDLIQKAANKKKALHDDRNRQNSAIMGWKDDNGELLPFLKHIWDGVRCAKSDAGEQNESKELWERLLNFSSYFLMFVELKIIKLFRFFAITLAILVLIIDASSSTESIPNLLNFKKTIDTIASVYYAIDGVAKMFSFLSYMEIAEDLNQKMSLTTVLRRAGCIDVPLATLCLAYVDNYDVNKWLHLIRCVVISFFFLEQMPQLDVLMSGISAGLRSTIYTWLLLALTFVVYSATFVLLFSESDPYHFGNVGMAMWTCFELSTLENWSVVMNINYWGCDVYPDTYINGTEAQIVNTELGSFYGPVCYAPEAKRIAASVVFVSFVLLCGFILISLTVAFVATGINNRLHELQEEEDKEELLLERSQSDPNRNSIFRRRSRRASSIQQRASLIKMTPNLSSVQEDSGESNSGRNSPSFRAGNGDGRTSPTPTGRSSFLANDINNHSVGGQRSSFARSSSGDGSGSGSSAFGGSQSGPSIDTELLRALLGEIWGTKDMIKKAEEDEPFDATTSFSSANVSTKRKSMTQKQTSDKKVERTRTEHFLLWLGVKTRSIVGNPYYHYFITLLIIYAAGVELIAAENRLSPLIINASTTGCQVMFSIDIAMRIGAYAPKYASFWEDRWNAFDAGLVLVLWIPYSPIDGGSFFELLKVLRILRLLKMLSWIFELNIIMKSISTSAKCLVYVIFMMLVFFFHFGVAGVYLFQQNDPFHFSNIGRALVTLLQVSTLDNWSDVARMNIYGCMYVGFDPDYCSEERNNGWGWVAAWYFIIFIIIGVMVLVSLFVGVIITSMELLQISIKDESEMLKKVWAKQNEYKISNSMVASMLEIFDMVDLCANGRLTLHELKPVLSVVDLDESNQFEIFHRIDEDSSGKIDFSEFCELIMLIKSQYVESRISFPEVVGRVLELKGENGAQGNEGNESGANSQQTAGGSGAAGASSPGKEPTKLMHMSSRIVSSFTDTLKGLQRASTESKLAGTNNANTANNNNSTGGGGSVLDQPAFVSPTKGTGPKPMSSAGSATSLSAVVAAMSPSKKQASSAALISAGAVPASTNASNNSGALNSSGAGSGMTPQPAAASLNAFVSPKSSDASAKSDINAIQHAASSESVSPARSNSSSGKHNNIDALSRTNAHVDDIETITDVTASSGSNVRNTSSNPTSTAGPPASTPTSSAESKPSSTAVDGPSNSSQIAAANSSTSRSGGSAVSASQSSNSTTVQRQHTFPPDSALPPSSATANTAQGSNNSSSSSSNTNAMIANNNKVDEVDSSLVTESVKPSEPLTAQKSITNTRPSFTGKAFTDTQLMGVPKEDDGDRSGYQDALLVDAEDDIAPFDGNILTNAAPSGASTSIINKADSVKGKTFINYGATGASVNNSANSQSSSSALSSDTSNPDNASNDVLSSGIPRIRWKQPANAADKYKLTEN